MTSLSIRLSNAIKLSPGKDGKVSGCCNEPGVCLCTPNNKEYDNFYQELKLLVCSSFHKPELILVFILSLSVFFALLSFRIFDDNRLTSWQWIFSQADMPMVALLLITGLLVSMVLSGIKISHQQTITGLIFLSALISMLHWRNPEVIVDAARYFSQAKYLEMYGIAYFLGQWGQEIMAWTDLPLMPFIYGIIFKFFGENRIGIQLINTLFFSGTVLLTYCIGRAIWNTRIGLYAAIMLLAIPYLHTQIPLLMVDVAAMFFLTLSIFLFIKSVKQAGYVLPILAVVSIILAMLTKYSNWLMLSVIPVIAFVYYNNTKITESRINVIRQSGIIILCFSLFFGMILLWWHETFIQQISLLVDYQLAVLGGWSESHFSTFLFQMHPFISLAAVIAIYLAYRKRDYKFLIISWMLIILLLLDIKRIRYVLIAFPMIALMAGYALSHIDQTRVRRYLALSIFVSACTISVLGHAAFLNTSSAINLKHAGEYIDTLQSTGVEVITLSQPFSSVNPVMSIPLLDLYTQAPVYTREEYSPVTGKEVAKYSHSPLRFTWEYKLPKYYRADNKSNVEQNIFAVVLGKENQILPGEVINKLSGYYKVRSFKKQENIFRFTTIVDIYLPTQAQENTTI